MLVLYHEKNEHASNVEGFVRSIKEQTSRDVELISLETTEGASIANTYEIVSYPATLIIRDDGQLHKYWEGESLPLIGEVVGYLNS